MPDGPAEAHGTRPPPHARYPPPMHLLLVEDDPRLRGILVRLLEDERHLVVAVGTGGEALEIAEGPGAPELVILDLGLPDLPGLEVARRIRARGSAVPILVLTARDTVEDRVAGLDAGADDYVVKPFAPAELSARIRALGRRAPGAPARTTPLLTAGPIALDETTRSVTVDGRPVELSPREFSLLECLLRNAGRPLSRDQLLDRAWPYGVAVTPNAVDAYIHYLREKLGPAGERIRTIRGVGYRLDDA